MASENPDLHVVVVFEPHRDGEPPLSLAEQVQQVFGPFDNDTDAEHFAETFKKRCPGINWQFLVTPLDSSNDIPTDPESN